MDGTGLLDQHDLPRSHLSPELEPDKVDAGGDRCAAGILATPRHRVLAHGPCLVGKRIQQTTLRYLAVNATYTCTDSR